MARARARELRLLVVHCPGDKGLGDAVRAAYRLISRPGRDANRERGSVGCSDGRDALGQILGAATDAGITGQRSLQDRIGGRQGCIIEGEELARVGILVICRAGVDELLRHQFHGGRVGDRAAAARDVPAEQAYDGGHDDHQEAAPHDHCILSKFHGIPLAILLFLALLGEHSHERCGLRRSR